MIPITKNIFVIDENGNSLEPTYTKRAKGLVKNERAQWVGDKTICINTTTKSSEIMEAKILDKQVFEYIKEEIELLKLDLTKDIYLNSDSEYQPQAAAEIFKIKDGTKREIIKLLHRLIDLESGEDQNTAK